MARTRQSPDALTLPDEGAPDALTLPPVLERRSRVEFVLSEARQIGGANLDAGTPVGAIECEPGITPDWLVDAVRYGRVTVAPSEAQTT
ncbi:MAG: hypothetical protein KF847_19690 [Pirellulales bacterium]|nr:hypothetical protein [Pirellulales bacterium]